MKTLNQFKAHVRGIVRTLAPIIVTKPVYPPIPTDSCDWVAYYDGNCDAQNYGWGPTEEAAIEDLKASYEQEGRE